jgi:hypothetical protein
MGKPPVRRVRPAQLANSRAGDLFTRPLMNQVDIGHASGLGQTVHGLRLTRFQSEGEGRVADEDRFGDFLQLLLEVGQVVRIPELGQFFGSSRSWGASEIS